MKKVMIAALASLMFAGALSAISCPTSGSSTNNVTLIGEGPVPFLTLPPPGNGDMPLPSTNQFK